MKFKPQTSCVVSHAKKLPARLTAACEREVSMYLYVGVAAEYFNFCLRENNSIPPLHRLARDFRCDGGVVSGEYRTWRQALCFTLWPGGALVS